MTRGGHIGGAAHHNVNGGLASRRELDPVAAAPCRRAAVTAVRDATFFVVEAGILPSTCISTGMLVMSTLSESGF
jgi:hypothetical protein